MTNTNLLTAFEDATKKNMTILVPDYSSAAREAFRLRAVVSGLINVDVTQRE